MGPSAQALCPLEVSRLMKGICLSPVLRSAGDFVSWRMEGFFAFRFGNDGFKGRVCCSAKADDVTYLRPLRPGSPRYRELTFQNAEARLAYVEALTPSSRILSGRSRAKSGLTLSTNPRKIWRANKDVGDAFTMLTMEAGPDIARYHDRQIAIISRTDWTDWLDPAVSARADRTSSWWARDVRRSVRCPQDRLRSPALRVWRRGHL